MAVSIKIKLDNVIRDDIRTVSKYCEDKIDIIFDFGTMELLGYTKSAFCLCKEIVECNVPYNISIEPAVILSMLSYQEIEFNISDKSVHIIGFSKNKSGREVQVKFSNDPMANYQADFYRDVCDSLSGGYTCSSLEQLMSFDRISRINDKSERGITISNGYFYTCGDMFKFFAKTEAKFNCFILSDDLKNLIDFIGKNNNTIYEQNGFIISKSKGDCFFGVRIAEPQYDLESLKIVIRNKPIFSFSMDLTSLKSCMRPIKTPKSNDGVITFKPKNGLVIIGLVNAVYKLPFEYNNLSGDSIDDVKFNFKQFNKLIQSLSVTKNTKVMVYNRFIAVMSANDSILLIGRG